MTDGSLLEKIGREIDQIIDLLGQMVRLESPSTHKKLVDDLGSFIARALKENGLSPQIEPRNNVGDIVWAEWGKNANGSVLVLCHIDTVWEPGSLARNPFRVQNGCIYGPGIYDMKSGVMATLKIQEYLAKGWILPGRKVRFLYTTDEETGSHESRELIETFARQSNLVLVTEPPLPGGALKTFRKGVGDFILKIYGRAAHAGVDPEKGINAVEELARQILSLHALSNSESGTTVTVTVVRGGTRENVIPEYAEARIDARFKTIEEGRRVAEAIQHLDPHLKGARLEIEGEINRPPMIKTPRTEQLFQSARQIAREMGMDLYEGESGGGSDGSYCAALGIPTLDGLGVMGDGAHSLDEHVELDALVPRVALLGRLIERL